VSTLTGSILARNRSLPLRLTVPPALFFLSLNYFLPQTSTNLFSYIGELEDTYVPTIAEKHDISVVHTKMAWEMVKDTTRGLRQSVAQGAVNAVGRVQNSTGLRVGDAFGRSVPKQQEQVVEEQVVEEQVVEGKVENNGEEIKKLV
jgi:MICOS complex subunit MIC26